ncbi:MAG: DUF1439 domain-containing protein [Polyangia bacterium]
MLALVLVASGTAACSTTYTVNVSASQIRQAVERHLPVSKSKLLVTGTVRKVDIELAENADRIMVRPEVDLSLVGYPVLVGRAVVQGQIRYAPESGEFFLTMATVDEVAVEGLPGQVRPVVEQLIANIAEGYLAAVPLYRLSQTDFKQSLARLVLRSVRVHQGRLELVLGLP